MSREDADDATERARMHAWACRSNKNIKKNNMKAELEGNETESEKARTEAPTGSIANVQPELPVVKKCHDHVFLQANQRAAEEISSD